MKTLKSIFTFRIAAALVIVSSFAAGNAYATPYGTNITKADGITSRVYGGHTYTANGSGVGAEDNEAEPGMVQSQAWDLEGFFLNGSNLSIVGGYNFYTGEQSMKAGDIFIDTNGDAIYSPNTIPAYTYTSYGNVSNALFKYDYVLDINWVSGTFNVVKLTNSSILKDTEYGSQYNQPSNPWVYVSSSADTILSSGNFNTYGKTSQTNTTTFIESNTDFSGWNGNNNHFAATFEIAAVDLSSGGLFHNTMQCGNDNLIGEVAPPPVPEPGTMMLLGFGMLSLIIYGKRRMNKEA